MTSQVSQPGHTQKCWSLVRVGVGGAPAVTACEPSSSNASTVCLPHVLCLQVKMQLSLATRRVRVAGIHLL